MADDHAERGENDCFCFLKIGARAKEFQSYRQQTHFDLLTKSCGQEVMPVICPMED